MDEAKGTEFFQELIRIKDADFIAEDDKKKILILSDVLVKLHSKRATGTIKDTGQLESLYRRKIRDTIGSGESIMGVFDMYPAVRFADKKDFNMFVNHSIRFWTLSRDMSHRLCQVHGDFHPGNLWFNGDNLTVLDRARGEWGEAADDIAAFLINPILLSTIRHGRLQGALKELFDLFWNDYFGKTKDREMRQLLAAYFAFRVSVICNPLFYEDSFFGDAENADRTRRRLFNLAINSLKDNEFNPEKINKYLRTDFESTRKRK
jgi:streptomycin 6-kinase